LHCSAGRRLPRPHAGHAGAKAEIELDAKLLVEVLLVSGGDISVSIDEVHPDE
jgi:hypothetical protein